jgi:hypothetical protein
MSKSNHELIVENLPGVGFAITNDDIETCIFDDGRHLEEGFFTQFAAQVALWKEISEGV